MKPNFSQSIAADMSARLQSEEFESLFDSLRKQAGKEDEKCHECHACPCKCDMSKASDSSSTKSDSEDSSKVDDANDAASMEDKEDSCMADDPVTAALDEAFGHLLSASAVLDTAGFEKSATVSLNLASFIVEAKKKLKDKKKGKSSDSKSSGKSDSKKSDSKKSSDSKAKSSSKSSKK